MEIYHSQGNYRFFTTLHLIIFPNRIILHFELSFQLIESVERTVNVVLLLVSKERLSAALRSDHIKVESYSRLHVL